MMREHSAARPVLILGGYGSLGSRTAQVLRRLHADLQIVIAGRDEGRASALAAELRHAAGVSLDLERDDLGLPEDLSPAVVVTALRDLSLRTQRYASAKGAAYVALSDGIFELGPAVAAFSRSPEAAPVVLLGHGMGSVPTLAALHATKDFRSIDAIALGLVFDPGDPLGPASQIDMERIGRIGPSPLILDDGRWCWVSAQHAARPFAGVDGAIHQGQAVGLVDVLSLAAAPARSIRVDFAEGATSTTRSGGPPSHEVIVEIEGERRDGRRGRFRYELVDSDGYAALSAKGVAVVVESLLGLSGRVAPKPGLYLPEQLVDTEHLMRRLAGLGVVMRAVSHQH